jgi:dephospho-CoA kinase
MLTLKKVAIIGTIGSGKSSVCKIFYQLGAYVVEADKIVHELLDKDRSLKQQLIAHFGPDILTNDRIDREKLANVFKDDKKLKILEDLVHPKVFEEIERRYQHAKKEQRSLFVVEIPLLFECNKEKDFDVIILVKTKPEILQKRLQEHPIKNVSLRLKRLIPQEIKEKKADIVLENNESFDALEKNVQKLIKQLTKN